MQNFCAPVLPGMVLMAPPARAADTFKPMPPESTPQDGAAISRVTTDFRAALIAG